MISHHAVLFSVEQPLEHTPSDYLFVSTTDQYRMPQFGIDDVRQLISHAYRRPDSSQDKRVIIVATEFITEEAQQALLKVIEEPPLSTAFVFIIPHGYSFLPTLESRFERVATEVETQPNEAFDVFMEASYAERMSQIEQSVKQKNHVWQSAVKKGLVQYLKQTAISLPHEVLSELEYVSRTLLTRGASNKFLLEHLALTLPA